MAERQLDQDSIIPAGASVRIWLEDVGEQRDWSGVVVSTERGMLSIRLKTSTDGPPSEGDDVSVYAQRDGVLTDFQARVEAYVEQPAPTLLLSVPTQVETESRRRFPRASVEIPAQYRLYPTESSGPHEWRDSLIVDISKGGAGVASDATSDDPQLLQLRFELPGKVRMDVDCLKRGLRPVEVEPYTGVMGLEFIMITLEQRKALGLFLTATSAKAQPREAG